MKNINKKTKVKFGFLLFIGLLIVIVFVSQLKGASDDKKEVKESEIEEIKIDEVDEEKLKEIENDYKGSDKQVDKNEEVTDSEDDDSKDNLDIEENIDSSEVEDYHAYYVEKYGEELVEDLDEKVEQIIEMMFLQEVTENEWLNYIDKHSYEISIKEESGLSLNKFKGEKLSGLTVSPVVHVNQNEIMFEAKVDWSYGSEDEQVSLVYVTYDATNKENVAIELLVV